MEQKSKQDTSPGQNSFSFSMARNQAIAGLSAGALSTLFLHPVDLVKTKLQANDCKTAKSQKILGRTKIAVKEILKGEGVAGLYRGLSPNMIGSALSWSFYFAWYSLIKQAYSKELGDGSISLSMTSAQHMLASAEAGALTVLCTNPIWVVKTRIFTSSVNHSNSYRGLMDGLVKLARHEGIPGLYKGLIPALFGTSHGAFQFMAYEELKRWKATRGPISQGNKSKLSTFDYIWMSTFSKIFASVTTYPYQVVKTRIQRLPETALDTRYEGVIDSIRKIYSNEGILGFYKGLGPNTARVLPGTCITFFVYETLSGYFRNNSSN